jgi:hypothetical protein
MVTLLVIGLQQCIPFPNFHAPTPWHSICVCIAFRQEPALVVHRGWSVSVTLTTMLWGYCTFFNVVLLFLLWHVESLRLMSSSNSTVSCQLDVIMMHVNVFTYHMVASQ